MSNIKDISAYKSPGDTIIAVSVNGDDEIDGIFIPQAHQKETMFKIVETGLNFNSPDLKIGDTVLIAGKGGDRIDLQDTTYWIFPTEMVVATVEL